MGRHRVGQCGGAITAWAILLAALPSARAAVTSPMYLVDSLVGDSTQVFRIDQATGQLTSLGSLDISLGEAVGIAADGPDILYVTTFLGNVIKINLTPSFSPTTLGNVGGSLTQLDFDGGVLYAVDETANELSTISFSPLTKNVIGTIKVGSTMGPTLDI